MGTMERGGTMNTEEMIVSNRNATIAEIKRALKKRSGKAWSVTGGRGTVWGWLTIQSRPAQQTSEGMSIEDRRELAALLALNVVHSHGVKVPSSHAHRREYLHRANGITVAKPAEQYWD